MQQARIWYVGYGSNLSDERLLRYIRPTKPGAPAQPASPLRCRWLTLDRRMYFAGTSSTWGGAVAFLALRRNLPSSAGSPPTEAKAYLLSYAEFATVVAKENGYDELPWDVREVDVAVQDWVPVPVALAADGYKGKYNAALRLADIEGLPAFTMTTSHVLQLGKPAQGYLNTIVSGLQPRLSEEQARELLRSAQQTNGDRDNRAFIGFDATKCVTWIGPVSPGGSLGFPAIRLRTTHSGTRDTMSLRLGTLVTEDGKRRPVWVSYSLPPDAPARVTQDLAERVALTEGSAIVRVESSLPLHPHRIPGYTGDISQPDVVQVANELSRQLGGWVLGIAPHLSGPLRVVPRPHVPSNSMRIAYGVRTLFGVQGDEEMMIAPLPSRPAGRGQSPGRFRGFVNRAQAGVMLNLQRLAEFLLGAPSIALRATEGLVGDDGRWVVRVDVTAMDYLGIMAGQQAVISWADRSTRVRVLLHTEETSAWMANQLGEKTGRQYRDSLAEVDSRLQVPDHLRVWVSPTVRYHLEIPPDTVVRLRRSVLHLVGRNALTLSLPFFGLAIAALAVPGVPTWIWAIVLPLALVFALVPLRLGDRARAPK